MNLAKFIYTQDPDDTRGDLWTKYVLSWVMAQDDENKNTDMRIITLQNGSMISVANMFTVVTNIFDKEVINPKFENFLKTTAAYHAIITSDVSLAESEYAKKLYLFLHKNYYKMDYTIKKMYDMIFVLYKKMNSGILKKISFNENINSDDYDKYYIKIAPNNNFASTLPRKLINIAKMKNTSYKDIYLHYLNKFTSELEKYLDATNNKSYVLASFYDNYVRANDTNKSWNLINPNKIQDTWNLNATRNKCYGLGITDVNVCKELMIILNKPYNLLSLKDFMLKYSQPENDFIWPSKNVLIDSVSRGKVNLAIARRFMNLLGFKFYYTENTAKIGALAFYNWINKDARETFKDPNFAQSITANKKVGIFLKTLAEYVAITYPVNISDDLQKIINLNERPKEYKSRDDSKTWNYAEGYKEYLENLDQSSIPPSKYNTYDFLTNVLLSNDLLTKLSWLNDFTIPEFRKNKELSIDEYLSLLEPPKQKTGLIKVMSGGCKQHRYFHQIEKIYKKVLNHMKLCNYVLAYEDKKNLDTQIFNLNVYWFKLNHATKKVSESKNIDNERDIYLRRMWLEHYNKFILQEKKVLASLTKLMKITKFFDLE